MSKQSSRKHAGNLERVDDIRWRIARTGAMRTEGLIFLGDELVESVRNDPCLDQVSNVAQLPGIVGPSMAMPDIHWGYGFPIGGVAAFDASSGIISPGGVGFDINCGVRLLRSDLELDAVRRSLGDLLNGLYARIPAGVGATRQDIRLDPKAMDAVLSQGARWCIRQGHGTERDLEFIEDRGCIEGARPDQVSPRARTRGAPQLGTLGSGNHFCEIGYVDEIYDETVARILGLELNTVTFLIHTGSRGLGYQVCDEFLPVMLEASRKYGIDLPDPQLCAAPLDSEQGRAYLGAMAAAANYAFANRQLITAQLRLCVEQLFQIGPASHRIELVYDVAHNIAKLEVHQVQGAQRRLCVHRKGATRAFPPGHPDLPAAYSQIGQPVLVPGDMGRYSFVLVGTQMGYQETFGSTCHGAGRLLSRMAAKKKAHKRDITAELKRQGIRLRAASRATVNEEMPEAYKDVSSVVDVVHRAGIAKKVARLKPIAVMKG
ncbi:MAG: RtcB family protein [Bradymonadales bacterium]|nr:RtcB family protein [Bradymonadales bacterium]